MESRKFYAGKLGAVLDSDVYKGGGTDDTDALQAILDKAPVLGRLHLVLDGAARISRSLKIYSNTTIECPDKSCGVFLSAGSNCPIIGNANQDLKYIQDRNITLMGGVYNHNSPGQVHDRKDEKETYFISNWVFAALFCGVENLTLRDVTIANQRTFAAFTVNWKNVLMENIHIDRRHRPDGENQDGLHFWGPGRFLTLRNIHGNAGDDFIALAPDEHDLTASIEDVLIDGVHLEESDQAIRLLVRGTGKLDRVIIKNVTGTYRSYGFIINPWFEGKGGKYGNIVFDTIDLRPMKPNYTYSPPFLFKLGGNIEGLTVKNLYLHTPEYNHRLFYIGGHYNKDEAEQPDCPTLINRLIIDGLLVNELNEAAFQDTYFSIKSKVDYMSVKNVVIQRNPAFGKKGSLLRVEGGGVSQLWLTGIYAPCLAALIEAPPGSIKEISGDSGVS
jgi:polygalacturonase